MGLWSRGERWLADWWECQHCPATGGVTQADDTPAIDHVTTTGHQVTVHHEQLFEVYPVRDEPPASVLAGLLPSRAVPIDGGYALSKGGGDG